MLGLYLLYAFFIFLHYYFVLPSQPWQLLEAAACSEDAANDKDSDQVRPSQRHFEPALDAGGARLESKPLPGEAEGALTEQKQH